MTAAAVEALDRCTGLTEQQQKVLIRAALVAGHWREYDEDDEFRTWADRTTGQILRLAPQKRAEAVARVDAAG